MNYTKGEWQIHPNFYKFIAVREDGLFTTIAVTEEIHGDKEMARANAHLISAAPDMYEALRDLMFQFAVAVEQPHSVDTRIYNQAEQALAKAEGREG